MFVRWCLFDQREASPNASISQNARLAPFQGQCEPWAAAHYTSGQRVANWPFRRGVYLDRAVTGGVEREKGGVRVHVAIRVGKHVDSCFARGDA